MRFEDLPYRPCVGVALFNRDGLVFVGRRIGGPEHIDLTHFWQLPQGGIDSGEEPWPAALRELREETNVRAVERIGEIAEWLTYDIPRDLVGEAWSGKYRGQKQKWFAMRHLGTDGEIDVAASGRPHEAEFWRGAGSRYENVPDLSCRSNARSIDASPENSLTRLSKYA